MRSDEQQILKGWVLVTQQSYPTLFRAFETISHDVGAGAGHTNYSVPPEWVDKLALVEKELSLLSTADLETLLIGEDSEAIAIVARSDNLLIVHKMLNAFFDDWENYW